MSLSICVGNYGAIRTAASLSDENLESVIFFGKKKSERKNGDRCATHDPVFAAAHIYLNGDESEKGLLSFALAAAAEEMGSPVRPPNNENEEIKYEFHFGVTTHDSLTENASPERQVERRRRAEDKGGGGRRVR